MIISAFLLIKIAFSSRHLHRIIILEITKISQMLPDFSYIELLNIEDKVKWITPTMLVMVLLRI